MVPDKSIKLIEKILSKTASSEEVEEFNEWVKKSEANLKFFQQSKAIWERLNRPKDNVEFDSMDGQQRMLSKIKQRHAKGRIRKLQYRISIAASILLLIGFSCLILNFVSSSRKSILYSTLDKEIKEIVLPDGSHVWLNENSVLQTAKAFNKNQRKVWLQGEAYFEVTHDKEKVFKVITGKITTKVLGTSFNLKTYNKNKVQLTVNSGRVKFYNRFSLNEREIFTAGSMGEYTSTNGQIQKMKNENMNYLSWKTGVLTFSDAPLDEVCKALTTHYKVNIKSKVDNPKISFTCTFHNDDLEDILSTIAITLDLEIIKPKNGEIIIQSRNH